MRLSFKAAAWMCVCECESTCFSTTCFKLAQNIVLTWQNKTYKCIRINIHSDTLHGNMGIRTTKSSQPRQTIFLVRSLSSLVRGKMISMASFHLRPLVLHYAIYNICIILLIFTYGYVCCDANYTYTQWHWNVSKNLFHSLIMAPHWMRPSTSFFAQLPWRCFLSPTIFLYSLSEWALCTRHYITNNSLITSGIK